MLKRDVGRKFVRTKKLMLKNNVKIYQKKNEKKDFWVTTEFLLNHRCGDTFFIILFFSSYFLVFNVFHLILNILKNFFS